MTEFTIKSVNLRGCWNLETINDECPICRNSVLEICVECSGSSSECVSVMGMCEHIYHLHCIERWTKTKNSCPLDNKKWEFKKPNICQVINSKTKPNFNQLLNQAINGAGQQGPAGQQGLVNSPVLPGLQGPIEIPVLPQPQPQNNIVLSDSESDDESDDGSDDEPVQVPDNLQTQITLAENESVSESDDESDDSSDDELEPVPISGQHNLQTQITLSDDDSDTDSHSGF